MGVGHHVRVDIGGRVVLASCHRRLFARRIGLVPVRQSQRLAYDRGLAHGDPDRRRRQPLRYHTPLGQGMSVLQRGVCRHTPGPRGEDQHDRERRPVRERGRGEGQRHNKKGMAIPHKARDGRGQEEDRRNHIHI